MGFFDFLRGPDIHQGLQAYSATPGAVLLDVRTPQEYRQGHIPESRNLPLQDIQRCGELIGDPDTPIFAYCHSGARSGQAVAVLKRMGYHNCRNIGGIAGYRGKVVG